MYSEPRWVGPIKFCWLWSPGNTRWPWLKIPRVIPKRYWNKRAFLFNPQKFKLTTLPKSQIRLRDWAHTHIQPLYHRCLFIRELLLSMPNVSTFRNKPNHLMWDFYATGEYLVWSRVAMTTLDFIIRKSTNIPAEKIEPKPRLWKGCISWGFSAIGNIHIFIRKKSL